MILYNSDYFGLLQLTIFSGSAVYRTILPSLVSTGMFFLYKYSLGHGETAQEIKEDEDEALYTIHPFVITIYIMAFSLIITHRLNYCYLRYWESCSNIFMMSSKWIDSATTLAAFHYQSIVYEEDRPRCFGDEDKPLDELKEKDKKKGAPTGGNTRTAMVNPGGINPMTYYGGSRDGLGRSSASDTSDSGSSVVSYPGEPSSLTVSAAREASMDSHRSFLTSGSRERVRKYSEEQNYNRAVKRFSSNSLSIENSIRQIFTWTRNNERKYQSKSSLSDWGRQSHSSSMFDGSSLLNIEVVQNTSENNVESTPPRGNLSTVEIRKPSPGLGVRKSLSAQVLRTIRGKRSHRQTTSDYISRKHDRKEGTFKEKKSNHRRVPSTDIPKSGIDGSIVKSFKPNPSLAWQQQNRTAMPRNTGLHSTVFQAPFDFDFEKLLLDEEKERKREATKQRQEETGRESIFETAVRRRSSLPNFRKSLFRSISNTDSAISEGSPDRIASEPTRGSASSSLNKSISNTVNKSINSADSRASDIRRPTVTNFMPRLELHDLPCLYERPSVMERPSEQSSENSNGQRPSAKKARVTGPDPLAQTFAQNRGTNFVGSSERQSPVFRPPLERMNGRASLFLQEVAHLYSLMSAVAMSSLRADMEGVSSPLVDYVPGQVRENIC